MKKWIKFTVLVLVLLVVSFLMGTCDKLVRDYNRSYNQSMSTGRH